MISVRSVFWGVNLLLFAGVAYSASVTAARVLERELVRNTPTAAQKTIGPAQQRSKPRMPLGRFQAVLDANVFRAKRSVAAVAPTPVVARATPAPTRPVAPTKLPLKISLTGTIVMARNSVAFVVGPDGRSEGVYHLRECVPHLPDKPLRTCTAAQAKLVKIRSSSITVLMNQKRYVVKIGEQESDGAAASTALRPTGQRKRPTGIKRRSAKRSFASTTQGNTIEMRIPNVEVEKAFENFAGIVNQARVVPYMVNGAPQGFQIRKIVPGSIFERLGLSNGDIIKSVNGESLTTADKALRLFTVFRNEREINLEIERGSKPMVLSYIVE